MNAPLLIASGLTKTYGGVHALKSADFELHTGEVHALVGENGAGKSTIIKILSGAVQPDSGVITLAGETIAHNNPVLARRLGISVIYQQPALFPDLTVAENIALTLDNPSPWRKIDWRARRDRAQTLLDSVGAAIDPGTRVSELSMPEQQLVEIARALGANARVLILDEPTASLTDREVEKLFAVIRGMRARGVGVIYVSHRLEELFQIADRVTILRDGAVIRTKMMTEVDRDELIHLMVGRQLSAVFPKREVAQGDVILEARDLTSKAVGIRDISFTVRAGEILGFAGLVGAGRTELAEVLFGLHPIDSGEILLRGQPASIESPKDAVDLGIAYVPEDRRHHGVILDLSIAANTSLANLAAVSSHGFIAAPRERTLAADYLQRLSIKAASIDA
ncbi:MAG: sugar ABC transporter ATP-binding protein, partial [Bryobacteraceae bacterium]